MAYGIEIRDASGILTFSSSDYTARMLPPIAVTMPSANTPSRQISVSSMVTSNNALPLLDNGGPCAVTSTGVVTIYSATFIAPADAATVLRIYIR